MSKNNLILDSFRYNIIIMKLFGLFPFDNWQKIYKVYAFFLYFFFNAPTPILAATYLVFTEDIDLEKICNNFFLVAQLGVLLVKLWPFKNNPEAVLKTVAGFRKEVFNSYKAEQEVIINEAVKEFKFIFYAILVASLASLFTWYSRSFFYAQRSLPLDIWLPFDPLEATWIYVTVMAYLFVSVLHGAMDNVSLDTLIVGMMFQSAAQVKILKDNLQFLDEQVEQQLETFHPSGSSSRDELKARIVYKNICKCIDHYEEIYEYTKNLKNTYSLVVFSQLFASILVICISCLQLSMVQPFTIQFFGMVIYIITMLMQVFLYCYYGTILYEESNNMTTAIYMSNWYNYDQTSKKCLITLMERAKRPMEVTVGNFFQLSLHTFTTILRRSYSLLAVLKNY